MYILGSGRCGVALTGLEIRVEHDLTRRGSERPRVFVHASPTGGGDDELELGYNDFSSDMGTPVDLGISLYLLSTAAVHAGG